MSRARLDLGGYAPTTTFFDPETEELDLASAATPSALLKPASSVWSPWTMGSNGEAVHLTRAEHKVVIHQMRSALVEAGFASIPAIAGASAQSIRGTIELCRESADTGSEYALIMPPCPCSNILAQRRHAIQVLYMGKGKGKVISYGIASTTRLVS